MRVESKFDNPVISACVLIILLTVVCILWRYIPDYLAKDLLSLSDKGQFGDSFGAVNALFTGLAFAGLIFTILLQQREIKLQRQDFSLQIVEMAAMREETQKQSELIDKQIRLGICEIKMKTIDIRLKEIELMSLRWSESVRYEKVEEQLKALQKEASDIVESISG